MTDSRYSADPALVQRRLVTLTRLLEAYAPDSSGLQTHMLTRAEAQEWARQCRNLITVATEDDPLLR
jgi:hypothetical protein